MQLHRDWISQFSAQNLKVSSLSTDHPSVTSRNWNLPKGIQKLLLLCGFNNLPVICNIHYASDA